MNKILKFFFKTSYLALAWTILIQVLLCLPGSAIPDEGAFIPNIDKIVHTILFGGFTAFWCLYVNGKGYSIRKKAGLFFLMYLLACLDGIMMEYVQKYYIPNRSFDQGDIIVDVLSASISYGLCNVYLLFEPRS